MDGRSGKTTGINGLTKETKSLTGPVTWSVRKVDPDTRRIIEKAADRIGKTLGEYINQDVRAFAQSQLTESQLPQSPKDVQNQLDHLTRLVETIAARIPDQTKGSVWDRWFKKTLKT